MKMNSDKRLFKIRGLLETVLDLLEYENGFEVRKGLAKAKLLCNPMLDKDK